MRDLLFIVIGLLGQLVRPAHTPFLWDIRERHAHTRDFINPCIGRVLAVYTFYNLIYNNRRYRCIDRDLSRSTRSKRFRNAVITFCIVIRVLVLLFHRSVVTLQSAFCSAITSFRTSRQRLANAVCCCAITTIQHDLFVSRQIGPGRPVSFGFFPAWLFQTSFRIKLFTIN